MKSRLARIYETPRNVQRESFADWSTKLAADMRNGSYNRLNVRRLIGVLSMRIESGEITLREAEDTFLNVVSSELR